LDLLPFYAILRSIPNKLLGVISMFVAILILLALPFVDTSNIKGCAYNPLYTLAFWIFALNFILLMWLGSCHVEPVRRLNFIYRGYLIPHQYSNNLMMRTKLGNIERMLLNIAFLPRILFMIKAILLKSNHSLFSNMGKYISMYLRTYSNWWFVWMYGVSDTNSERIRSKNESLVSKKSVRIYKGNSGLPKEINFYGNRAIILPVLINNSKYDTINLVRKGRIAAIKVFNVRWYTTDSGYQSSKNIIDKLKSLHERSIICAQRQMPIDRKLYNILCDIDLLKWAYENLKSKPINFITGMSPETLGSVSIEVLNKIIVELKDESFQFQPSRPKNKSEIKEDYCKLLKAPIQDKLVQEMMRLVLNAVYDPRFSSTSHGFRPNYSSHSALKNIHKTWEGSTWLIRGDINKCFDNIDHHKLMKIIEKVIIDRKFTRLIWKNLRAGYFEFTLDSMNIIGTPKGNIISPILANIYLDQLDKYVENLKSKFDIGINNSKSIEGRKIEYKLIRALRIKDNEAVRTWIKLRGINPVTLFRIDKFKKMDYVRYADNWLIGVKGNHKDCLDILNKIKLFLLTIGLKINEDKSQIINISENKVLFLGTNIFMSKHRKYFNKIDLRSGYTLKKRLELQIRLFAPLKNIIKKWQGIFIKKNKTKPNFLWYNLNHSQILYMYNSVSRDYLNYYSFAHNYNEVVNLIQYILKSSCAKLLAAKFNLKTQKKVFEKFGRDMGVTLKIKGKKEFKRYSFLPAKFRVTGKF